MAKEKETQEIKTYVQSNIMKIGVGPEMNLGVSLLAKQEIFGANVIANAKDKIVDTDAPGQPVSDVDEIESVIAASDKVKLELTDDLTLTAPIDIPEGKQVKIDLGGNTITANNTVGFVVNGGKLTISNGTVTGSLQAVGVESGEAIIQSGDFITTSAGQVAYAKGESKLVINGGNFNGQEAAIMAFDGGTIEINGGNFETIDNFAVGTNGLSGRGSNTIIINGGKLVSHITSTGYEACGVYVANNDTVTIGPDVEIEAVNGCGILMRGGTVTVKSGVQINLTSDKGEDFRGYVGDNKTKMAQSGIIYHESANYPGKAGMNLTVEDGVVINGIKHSIEVLSNEQVPKVTIGNGEYNPPYPEV